MQVAAGRDDLEAGRTGAGAHVEHQAAGPQGGPGELGQR